MGEDGRRLDGVSGQPPAEVLAFVLALLKHPRDSRAHHARQHVRREVLDLLFQLAQPFLGFGLVRTLQLG
ncbi:hypothetical protein [Sphingomonas sp. PP-CE-1G-424]|uniref:hypothetical protein n=1 Tax=Sphingomonas sp. PP-CE-1G-424 TaxID=2135658 RepID=UPI001FB31A9D|nr:hypothetical protein [Sphingomonas sp. PP-CE-1G-424]